MKPLLDNLLRLNTEEGRLVNAETELEAFGRLRVWHSGALNRQNDAHTHTHTHTHTYTHTHTHTDPTDCYNPLRMR